jgi:ankyrin repeat protein
MALELIQKYEEEFPKGTPLVCACEKGRLEDVKILMSPDGEHIGEKTLKEYVNQEGRDSRGFEYTPLMIAAQKEHFHVVQYLIEYEADPNIANSHGRNALHLAALNNRTNMELIQLLMTHMSLDSINKKDWDEETPLDYAHYSPERLLRQEIIDLIRSKGGKANRYDASGRLVGEGIGDLNNLHFRF